MAKDKDQIVSEFEDVVNMSAGELEDWLETEESKSVGQKENGESKGHKSGRRIVEILQKDESDYTDDDLDHMKKVHAYVKRHRAQEPGGVQDTSWRYSLINFSNAKRPCTSPLCHDGPAAGGRADAGLALGGKRG